MLNQTLVNGENYLDKSRHLLENQIPLQLVLGVETLCVFFNFV